MIAGRSSQAPAPEPTAWQGGGTACGHPLNYKGVARRPGDVAGYYADPQRAVDLLGWTAQRGMAEMCGDAWRPVSQAAPPLPGPWQRAGRQCREYVASGCWRRAHGSLSRRFFIHSLRWEGKWTGISR